MSNAANAINLSSTTTTWEFPWNLQNSVQLWHNQNYITKKKCTEDIPSLFYSKILFNINKKIIFLETTASADTVRVKMLTVIVSKTNSLNHWKKVRVWTAITANSKLVHRQYLIWMWLYSIRMHSVFYFAH